MHKIILNPGFLKSGKRCKNCIKSLEKTGNYCRRIEHSKVRYIEKKSNKRKKKIQTMKWDSKKEIY